MTEVIEVKKERGYNRDFREVLDERNPFLPLPVNPAKWISEKPEIIPVTMIKMSCGGGLGGAQWNEYVLEKFDDDNWINENNFIKVTTIEGEKKILNPRYIVELTARYAVARAFAEVDDYYLHKYNKKVCVERLIERGMEVELSDLVK